MNKVPYYKNLRFYPRAEKVVVLIHNALKNYPDQQKYALSVQMSKSSTSITSNIAEGSGKSTIKDFRNFLHIALGSARELESQLEQSYKLGFITSDEYNKINYEIDRLIASMCSYIKSINNTLNKKREKGNSEAHTHL